MTNAEIRSFINTSLGPTTRTRYCLGVEKLEDDDDGFNGYYLKIDLNDKHHIGYFYVPITEEIINAVISHPEKVTYILADITAAWGSINSYTRWEEVYNQKTPLPTMIRTSDGWVRVSEATKEQIEELNARREKEDERMEIIGNILTRYGLLTAHFDGRDY